MKYSIDKFQRNYPKGTVGLLKGNETVGYLIERLADNVLRDLNKVAEGEKVSTSSTPTFKCHPIMHQPDLGSEPHLDNKLDQHIQNLNIETDFDEQFEGGTK